MPSGSKKRKNSKNKNNNPGFVRDEIMIWSTLAVSIFIVISNFGVGGFVGEVISAFLKDIFGVGAYILPFLLFGIIAFTIINKGNITAVVKTVAAIFFFVLFCTFLHLAMSLGGLIGELIASLLEPAIGTIGAYVIVIILMIMCLVIITGKSAIKGVKSHSEKAYDAAKQDAVRRRALAVKRKEEKEAQQPTAEHKARQKNKTAPGVSFDTTLAKRSPEVRELTPPLPEGTQAVQEAATAMDAGFVINRGTLPDMVESPEESVSTSAKSKKAKMTEVEAETKQVEETIAASEAKESIKQTYQFPPISLLKKGKKGGGESDANLRETAIKLQQTLQSFGVKVTVTNVSCGPSVTRYELQPEQGVKVSKIVGLADDIKLNLAAADVRIEAPIPGKAAVGIEVPNKENATVMLRDLLETDAFKKSISKISFAAGRDIAGKVVIADIGKMPHVLVAGATGSGKSVCINTLIMSILYEATPEEVKLIMIDPKVVELSVYNGIPHLMIPVVTDPKKAAGALNWAVAEMERRYQLFAEYNVRDLKGYNEKIKEATEGTEDTRGAMPQIVIIVDELADLMMVAPGEVEGAICRLAQLARAAGLHLVLATQRPSVNVITGLIKANMPSRIAFSVSSGVDSRTIIDMNGAEKLLGKGDMLFYPSGYQKPARVQGAFVSDKEVQDVVEYLKKQHGDVSYNEEVVNQVNATASSGQAILGQAMQGEAADLYFAEAGKFIIDKEKASIGMLQRVFKIGFNRAARIMDQLCEAGVVGEEEGTKPRKVLMSMEEFEQYIEETM